MAKSKDVVKKENTLPAMNMMAEDAVNNSGHENIGAEDIAIPFVTVLQALSPQCRGETKLKGAEEGDLFNTVTGEIFKEGIDVIPCAFQKVYIEWTPRDAGGGLANIHQSSDILTQTTKNEKRQDVLPNGNIVVTTHQHFCIAIKENGTMERVVIAFTSTQLKKSKRWNAQMLSLQIKVGDAMVVPPRYSHIYTMNTVQEKNEHGEWSGFHISNPRIIEDVAVYAFAKGFYKEVNSGSVKVAPPVDDVTHTSDAADTQEHF